ncbi:phospholipase D-like domain-containing protein [Veillonella ratti]|uniref:phospholipase D-like domain-containing protein n=1 Tax=Veillonella ratti TaxID=103892 RepID=UPI0013DF202D|nr:phospholipase D-like domain-containing protein [Veillonella ratti]
MYEGIGIVSVGGFSFWVAFNTYYYFDAYFKFKRLSKRSDVIIKDILNKVNNDGNNIDYNQLKQELNLRIEETFEVWLSVLQAKYEQSDLSDKTKYKEQIEVLINNKEEKFEEGDENLKKRIKELELELSSVYKYNADLQNKVKKLEMIIQEDYKKIEDLEFKINTNNRTLDERNHILNQQQNDINQMVNTINQLKQELENAQGDKALVENLTEKLSIAENQCNLLVNEHKRSLLEKDELLKENKYLANAREEAIREKEEAVTEKQEIQKLLEEEKEENKKLRHEMAIMKQSFEDEVQRIEAQKIENAQILRNKEIAVAFREGLHSAEHEICIISPWVTEKVVNSYLNEFKRLAKNRVSVKIIFGMGKDSKIKQYAEENERKLINSRKAIEIIENVFKSENCENLFSTFERNTHAKLFLVDDKWYLVGSMNLLSFNYKNKKDKREELVEKIFNSKKIDAYKELFFYF